jgi:hypothetical protein
VVAAQPGYRKHLAEILAREEAHGPGDGFAESLLEMMRAAFDRFTGEPSPRGNEERPFPAACYLAEVVVSAASTRELIRDGRPSDAALSAFLLSGTVAAMGLEHLAAANSKWTEGQAERSKKAHKGKLNKGTARAAALLKDLYGGGCHDWQELIDRELPAAWQKAEGGNLRNFKDRLDHPARREDLRAVFDGLEAARKDMMADT